jgi:hypothetical protein
MPSRPKRKVVDDGPDLNSIQQAISQNQKMINSLLTSQIAFGDTSAAESL